LEHVETFLLATPNFIDGRGRDGIPARSTVEKGLTVLLRWTNVTFRRRFDDVDKMRFGKSPASSWAEGYKTDTISTRYGHPVPGFKGEALQ
jgi:hypothetical protein